MLLSQNFMWSPFGWIIWFFRFLRFLMTVSIENLTMVVLSWKHKCWCFLPPWHWPACTQSQWWDAVQRRNLGSQHCVRKSWRKTHWGGPASLHFIHGSVPHARAMSQPCPCPDMSLLIQTWFPLADLTSNANSQKGCLVRRRKLVSRRNILLKTTDRLLLEVVGPYGGRSCPASLAGNLCSHCPLHYWTAWSCCS